MQTGEEFGGERNDLLKLTVICGYRTQNPTTHLT